MQTDLKVVLSVLIPIGLVFLLIFGLFSPFAKIKFVELRVDPLLKDTRWTPALEQKFLLHIEGLKNQKIWSVNLNEAVRDLHEISPAVRPRIYRKLPHRLIVVLQKSAPLLLLLRSGGDIHPVSFQGDLRPPLPPDQFMDLPVLRGEVFYKNRALRERAVSLIRSLPDTGLFVPRNISEITYDRQKQTFIVFLIPGHTALKTKAPPSKKQILNINFVLEYLLKQKMPGRTIDARFEKKIIVSSSNSP